MKTELPLGLFLIAVDERNRRIGREMKENIHRTLKSLVLFPFTRRLNMTIQDIDQLVAGARRDASDSNLRAYFPV